jgi:Domain of unknown function (DUF3883)
VRANETGDWLTASRISRLPVVLRRVQASAPPGVPVAGAPQLIWKSCGGPLDEVSRLLGVLIDANLIVVREAHLRLTREGRTIATQDHQHGGTMLARALINAGYFVDQARRLTESSARDEATGHIYCRRSVAVGAAPQLVGILRRFPDVVWADRLVIPADLAAELSDIWVLPDRETGFDVRKAIGDRGELYSYRYEQMQARDPLKIHWVARDDDTLGYDIEDLNFNPRRRIETKASGGLETRFILSKNEWEVAHKESSAYEIHYWGRINLNRPARDEFAQLRRANFPLIYRDLPALVAEGVLTVAVSQYLVTASKNDTTGQE